MAADAGGDEARALAERLTAPLESALRLTLLEALSAAADEITRELAPGTAELRLRAGEPEFVVTAPPADEPAGEPAPPPLPETEDAATARINLRLPEQLKAGIEQAASRERLSVYAGSSALSPARSRRTPAARHTPHSGGWMGQAYKGLGDADHADLRHSEPDCRDRHGRRRRRPDHRRRRRHDDRHVAPTDTTNDEDRKAAEQTRVEYTDGRLLVRAPKLRSWLPGKSGGAIDVTIELPAGSTVQAGAALADFTSTARSPRLGSRPASATSRSLASARST